MVKSTVIVNKIVTKKKENISTGELEKALEISDVKEGKDKERCSKASCRSVSAMHAPS